MDARNLLGVVLIGVAGVAGAQPARFDGAWTVSLSCPSHNADDDDAKGYTHRFRAEVKDSRLSGTYGKEGEPGFVHLHGPIGDDGGATLRVDGLVNNPEHAIKKAGQGKAYTYRVKAQFDEKSGTGQRMTSRVCEFRFSR